jgi:hypothetical protein
MDPKKLSEDETLARIQICSEILKKIEQDANFINTVVTHMTQT